MADWRNAKFRKSSISSSGGCVEVAQRGDLIGVRDTKAKGIGPVLEFTRHEWDCFLAGAQAGEFEFRGDNDG
jgi:hypothetical protein